MILHIFWRRPAYSCLAGTLPFDTVQSVGTRVDCGSISSEIGIYRNHITPVRVGHDMTWHVIIRCIANRGCFCYYFNGICLICLTTDERISNVTYWAKILLIVVYGQQTTT